MNNPQTTTATVVSNCWLREIETELVLVEAINYHQMFVSLPAIALHTKIFSL